MLLHEKRQALYFSDPTISDIFLVSLLKFNNCIYKPFEGVQNFLI